MPDAYLILRNDWSELDADEAALLGRDGRADGTIGWFACLSATTLAAGERLRIAILYLNAQAVACLPLVARRRRWRGLSAPYTCRFSATLGDAAQAHQLGRALAALDADTLALDALDGDDPALAALIDGLGTGGWAVRRHRHFINHHAVIDDWPRHWQGMPSALRNTIARKHRKLVREHRLDVEIVRGGPALEAALTAYLEVYAESWKPAEPHPAFIPALAHAAARDGTLRLAIARIDGAPAAAQIWLVSAAGATIFKLAHRRALDPTSIGSLLTRVALEAVAEEGVRAFDFGRGDDAYKSLWLPAQRWRFGITAANPRRPIGFLHAARHIWAPELGRHVAGRWRR